MSARELAEPYPTVIAADNALDAVGLLAEYKLPALLVVDRDGAPYAMVPGAQLLGRFVPAYLQGDPLVDAGVSDRQLDEVTEKLDGLTVAELIPPGRFGPPAVGPEASALQIAALMSRTHSPLVAVVERDGDDCTQLVGAVTAARLMERFIGGQ
ncbi:CBS domain-containing protein [Streptomyces sp. NPDC102381]|uniref:CBS domain-containing protein n=1 Tax=Streptomyces sp. NPDC102381 TaxID=3366164 RepID=UPI0038113B66